MSEKEAKEKLSESETTEEQQKRAEALADQHTTNNSSGGGSVVVKHQLCGDYCDGCPHGPYAWLVDDEWTYLGKVGGGNAGDSASQQEDPESRWLQDSEQQIADGWGPDPENADYIHITDDGWLASGLETGEVHFEGTFENEYGDEKVSLNSPFEAKDDIKALDWDETHRSWNS